MRIKVSHPVPVRWRPARARRDRLAFRAEATSVDLPELPPGTFAETFETGPVYGRALTYAPHAGGLWTPVRERHLERESAPGTDPVPLERALAFLAERARATPGGLARAGSPLGGMDVHGSGRMVDPGASLPAPTRARVDHTDAARAALRRHVAGNLATDGRHLWMRVCPPVLMPCSSPLASADLPWYASRGPAFPVHRERQAAAFMVACGDYRIQRLDDARRRVVAVEASLYGEMDLDHFVDGAPAELEHAVERLRSRLALSGREMPAEVVAAMDRLSPLADLGRIGAIPPELRGEAVQLTLSAARAIRDACPGPYRPEALPWVIAYHETVAAPRLAAQAEALPEDDLDGLGRLAP